MDVLAIVKIMAYRFVRQLDQLIGLFDCLREITPQECVIVAWLQDSISVAKRTVSFEIHIEKAFIYKIIPVPIELSANSMH